MPAAPLPAVIAEINSPTTRVTRRVEVYESDGTTRWPGDNGVRLLDGSVSVDYARDERRSVDLRLDNSDNALRSDPNGGFWYDKILKVYRGVELDDGSKWEVQLGEFMIDRLAEPHFPNIVTVTGRDYSKKLQTSKFLVATQFTSGTTVETVIRAIGQNGGISRFLFPPTGKTLGRDFLFERGTPRWQAMTEIATAYGFEVFFDTQGFCVLQQFQDPSTSPLVAVYKTGAEGNLVSYDKSANDSRLYNHIVVTGEATDIAPVFASAKNEQPNSPTRIARIGERVYQYTSAFITTTVQAQDVANAFLKVHALEEYEVGLGSIVYPWLEAGDIVDFIDPKAGTNQPTRFLLSSFTIPLTLGAMTGSAKRVAIVSG